MRSNKYEIHILKKENKSLREELENANLKIRQLSKKLISMECKTQDLEMTNDQLYELKNIYKNRYKEQKENKI